MQRMTDFVHGKVSTDLPKTSYVPGGTSVDLAEVFPDFLVQCLRK